MTAKRTPINRPPRRRITPAALAAFRRMQALESQCTCTPTHKEYPRLRGLVGLAQSVGVGVALQGVAVPRDRASRRRLPLPAEHWCCALVAASASAVPGAGRGVIIDGALPVAVGRALVAPDPAGVATVLVSLLWPLPRTTTRRPGRARVRPGSAPRPRRPAPFCFCPGMISVRPVAPGSRDLGRANQPGLQPPGHPISIQPISAGLDRTAVKATLKQGITPRNDC